MGEAATIGRLVHAEELGENVQRQFYSLRSMLRRLPLSTTQANIASWVISMSERRMVRSTSGHNDFDIF